MLDYLESLVGQFKGFGECRWEERKQLSLTIEDGIVKKLGSNYYEGAFLRIKGKEGWISSSVVGRHKRDIERIWREMLSCVRPQALHISFTPLRERKILSLEEDPEKVSIEEKKELLKNLESYAKKESHYITHTHLSYFEEKIRKGVVNSLGTKVEEVISRITVKILVVAQAHGETQASIESRAWTGGFEIMRNLKPEDFSIPPVQRAIELLRASPPPSGVFPVIVSPQVSGILAHEALGHNLEGDHIIHGQSLLKGKIGERIGSSFITLVDDPTYPGAYGSYFFDDEGIKGKKKILVKEGCICGFLHSLETAEILSQPPTGNARAENYHFPPLVRMSNTYFLPGQMQLEEMIEKLKQGILVEKVGRGGYVLPEKGEFMLNIDYSFWIERGRKKKLLKNLSLSGNTLETLHGVKGASSHFSLSGSGGTCGKEGQGVPVEDGGPYFLIEKMLVGGRV